MRAKTLIEVLSLSTNLYMIAKDQEFLDNLSEMTKKGKKKLEDLLDDFGSKEGDDEETLLNRFLDKVKQAREELNNKMEEAAIRVYKKLQITHTDELQKVLTRIDSLEKQINLLESRLADSNKASH